jgi:hypothetical protein
MHIGPASAAKKNPAPFSQMGPGKFVPNRRATAGTVGALIHRISINQQGKVYHE